MPPPLKLAWTRHCLKNMCAWVQESSWIKLLLLWLVLNALNRVIFVTVKYLEFLRKRMNTNPSRGPYHFRAPSKIFWRTVRGRCNVFSLYCIGINESVFSMVLTVRSCNYRPQTKLWEGNVFTSVCWSFCSGGGVSQNDGNVMGPVCDRGCVTGGVCPPPGPVNKRAVHILLECFLVAGCNKVGPR